MKRLLILLCLLLTANLQAQTKLIVNNNIALPKDTAESQSLINDLNNFLVMARQPNDQNSLVSENEKLETYILLDEFQGIEKSTRLKDEFFYKPYLTNVSPASDGQYTIQLSYIGVDNSTPYLRASFELVAKKTSGGFRFASPLLRNASTWKTVKVGNNTFHYQQTINKNKLKEFEQLTSSFDKKLNVKEKFVDFYCCKDMLQLQKLVGVLYKADYNGRNESVWSASVDNRKLIVLGNSNSSFDNFDPHDLFHDRLSLVVSRSKVNKPVDEGCAYLYGGSWGYTWEEIFKAFKLQVAVNKTTNWTAIKDNPVYFKTGDFNNSADYIVNAILVREIEKRKGFAGVWQLLNVGPVEPGHEKYYQALEQMMGITKDNYNQRVWQLINATD